LVKEGVRICREHDIDFILAIGGGTVIDSAKAIAFGGMRKCLGFIRK
jgi:alcohol dehydrogenase